MRSLFVLVSFLIVYGSLYPFQFSREAFSDILLLELFSFDIFRSSLSDLVSNIILFIPFGFLSIKVLLVQKPLWLRVFVGLLLGFVVAFGVQVAQLWIPGRIASGADSIWNLIGCGIGFLSGVLTKSSRFLTNRNRYSPEAVIPLGLAILLIIFHWAPFVPSIDLQLLKDNLKGVVSASNADLFWIFQSLVIWWLIFHFLVISGNKVLNEKWFPLLVFGVLGVKFFTVGNTVTFNGVVGALLALASWPVIRRFNQPYLLVVVLTLSIIGISFTPFELRATTGSFHWIPFAGSLSGNILINIVAMMKKVLLYGSLIWLLVQARLSLGVSTLLVALFLFSAELAQIFFVNATPEITDAVLALFIGLGLYRYRLYLSFLNTPVQRAGAHSAAPVNKSDIQPKVIPTVDFIPGMDGLRALAALAVFFVHYNQQVGWQGEIGGFDINRLLANGNTGVALFFVLSGFLLSMPFWKAKLSSSGGGAFGGYFIRRLARILPAYYLCLGLILLGKALTGSYASVNNILTHLLFLYNLKDHHVLSLNAPFWTLAVEMQFYLLLPLIFLLFKRLSSSLTLTLIVLLIPAIYFLNLGLVAGLVAIDAWPISQTIIWPFALYINGPDSWVLKYSTLAHLPHFLIGVVVARLFVALTSGNLVNSRVKNLAEPLFWVASLIVVVILATPLDDILQIERGRYNFPFVPLLLAVMVLSVPFTRIARDILEFSVLRWLGAISYGVYIYHYPAQKVVLSGLGWLGSGAAQSPVLFLIASLLVTLILAQASYAILEFPVMKAVKRRYLSQQNINSSNEYGPIGESGHVTELSAGSEGGNCRDADRSSTGEIIRRAFAGNSKAWFALGVFTTLLLAVSLFVVNSGPRVIYSPAWSSTGNEIIFDHHSHTTYSDGSENMLGLANLAVEGGCDAFVISDHSSMKRAAGPEQLAEIKKLRKLYPEVLIFGGIELGMPSYGGREHVGIVVSPEYEDQLLTELRDVLGENLSPQRIGEGQLLKDEDIIQVFQDQSRSSQFIGIYNHPSRKDASRSENINDIEKWNTSKTFVSIVAGAPGHQRNSTVGSYREPLMTVNRWDPMVAEIGGGWDKLLSKGSQLWGALASSDYHNSELDEKPCAFSRTHLIVPERSYDGVIKALQSGTFWADHGEILQQFKFYVEVDGLDEPVYPGSVVKVGAADAIAAANVVIKRGEGSEGLPLDVEVIGNCRSGEPELLFKQKIDSSSDSALNFFSLSAKGTDNKSCYVRARVRLQQFTGQDLLAYSNPIRLFLE